MDNSNSYAPIIPLLASSLLNTVYLRILTTKNVPFDEQIYKTEFDIVLQQWRNAIPQLEKLYCNEVFDPSSVQKVRDKIGLLLSDEFQLLRMQAESLTEESQDARLKVAFHEMKVRFLQEILEIIKNP